MAKMDAVNVLREMQEYMKEEMENSTEKIKIPTKQDPPPGKFINILGNNIHYEKVGHGDHIVFLTPGAMGSTRTNFSAQLEKLNRDKFTIIAWDPPGYGYSLPPDRTFPLDYLIRDVKVAESFLEAMGVKKMSVFGWCQGGTTAIMLAARNPQMVQKLILLGAKAYISDIDKTLLDAFRDIGKFPPALLAANLSVYGEEYFKEKWVDSMDASRRIYDENQGNLCKDHLSLVQCPTLVLHGVKDKWIQKFHPEYLTDNIKNSRYHELSGGHNTHLQYPDEANKVIEEFLLDEVPNNL